MTIPLSHRSSGAAPHRHVGMNTKPPEDGRRIVPLVKKCYRFPYFIKGVPPHWLNPPPGVKIFRPFAEMRLKLELHLQRMRK